MANTQPSRLLTSFTQKVRSKGRRDTRDRSGRATELLMGNGGHQSAVDSAGIGHTHALIAGHGLP